MTTAVQTWIALVAGFATALLGVLKYFNYKSRRDRLALVGEHFGQTVEALGSQDQVRRLAAAILLRRFFDRRTEQGSSGAPYQYEAIRVIAALLRATEVSQFQKLSGGRTRVCPRHLRCGPAGMQPQLRVPRHASRQGGRPFRGRLVQGRSNGCVLERGEGSEDRVLRRCPQEDRARGRHPRRRRLPGCRSRRRAFRRSCGRRRTGSRARRTSHRRSPHSSARTKTAPPCRRAIWQPCQRDARRSYLLRAGRRGVRHPAAPRAHR